MKPLRQLNGHTCGFLEVRERRSRRAQRILAVVDLTISCLDERQPDGGRFRDLLHPNLEEIGLDMQHAGEMGKGLRRKAEGSTPARQGGPRGARIGSRENTRYKKRSSGRVSRLSSQISRDRCGREYKFPPQQFIQNHTA